MAPAKVKASVPTITFFLPYLSARTEAITKPVTLPTNCTDRIESLTNFFSQYRCICAVIVSGNYMEHFYRRVQASFSNTLVWFPHVNVGVTKR